MEIKKLKEIRGFALNNIASVRPFVDTLHHKEEYCKAEFLIKLIVNSNEGKGLLPMDLNLFMNGPKETADIARKYLQELQDMDLIMYKTDESGRPTEYILTL